MNLSHAQADSQTTRCGYVALIGRPNVGKSTLLNHLIGEKISITSRKPQTTQKLVLGIHTLDRAQLIFMDTPGVNSAIKKPFNRRLNKLALQSLADVDVIVWVVEAGQWTDLEDSLLKPVLAANKPTLLAINKIDHIVDKSTLLPWMAKIAAYFNWTAMVPISALKNIQLDHLQQEIIQRLPLSPFLFDATQKTDQTDESRVAEMIREKIVRQMGQELPYALTVGVDKIESKGRFIQIDATLYVQREGHKKMILGNGGQRIKAIGTAAREDLEKYFDQKVFLNCWVKQMRGQQDPDA
jgi:GTP-binding protein Era